MATCGLSPKVLKSLNVKIVKDLKVLAEANDTFVLKDYMKSVYDSVLNATSDHTLALDAARVVPKFVGTTAFNISTVSKLQGLNIAETMQVMNDLLEGELEIRRKTVIIFLRILSLIFPYKEKALFVQQALNAYLTMMKDIEKKVKE